MTKKTGFPWVALDNDRYISFLPLTKFQVEKYIWSGASIKDSTDPQDISLTESFCNDLNGGEYVFDYQAPVAGCGYTEKVTSVLKRRPLQDLHADEALLTINLPFCENGYDFGHGEPVPQTNNPAERVLKWLGCRLPDPNKPGSLGPLPTCLEYIEMQQCFDQPTFEYLNQVYEQGARIGIDRVALKIIAMLKDKPRFQEEYGLPFMSQGIWELTGDTQEVYV